MIRSNSLFRTMENLTLRTIFSVLSVIERGKRKPPLPSGPQNILISKWCCMGDAILSLYAIREFKRLHGDYHIEMLVSSRIAEIYRQSTDIDDVHVLPVTGKRLWLEIVNPQLWFRFTTLLFHLRRRKFTQFIDLELYRGTGPLLKRLLGIPYSRGFQVEGALPKNHDFEVPRTRTMLEWQCFYLVLGLEIPAQNPQSLFSPPPAGIQNSARRIGIVYGSSFNWPQKKWPLEFFAETILLLAGQGYEFVLFGDGLEKTEGHWIKEKCATKGFDSIRDTSGTLDFSQLRREVSTCDLILGNDTGTLHLASACGIPTVTLFGPTDPVKWNGLTSTPLFISELPCRPCYYLGTMPPCSHFSCLRKLLPSRVADQIRISLNTALPQNP